MSGFLREITGLCLMRLLMEMLLPEGECRRYAEAGIGLMLMICMLHALQSLLRGGI